MDVGIGLPKILFHNTLISTVEIAHAFHSMYVFLFRMNETMISQMAKMVKICGRSFGDLTIEELQVTVDNPDRAAPSISSLLSGLSLLLREWTVKILDVTKLQVDGLSLICLLCLNTSFLIRSDIQM